MSSGNNDSTTCQGVVKIYYRADGGSTAPGSGSTVVQVVVKFYYHTHCGSTAPGGAIVPPLVKTARPDIENFKSGTTRDPNSYVVSY